MNWRISAPFGELLTTWRTRCHLTQAGLATALGIHRNTIGRWEQGVGLPGTNGMVLELARLLQLNAQETRLLLEASQTALNPYWTVPFQRNPSFTGRDTLLQRLHNQLTATNSIALTQASTLSGLGGIGKTQLAIEYAYRSALEYTAVFWLASETTESLMMSMQQIADQLQLPTRQTTNQRQMVSAVQQWLATHAGWLLIADNVEDLDLLQRMLPPGRQGALLLTTRRQTLGNLAELLAVPPLGDEEGVNLLLQRAHRLGMPLSSTEAAAATEVVRLLEGLPLALDQAGAYIEETACSVTEYLLRYQQQRKQVLARRGMYEVAHPDSVTTTLTLSIAHVECEHPGTADLLRFCAFLHPEAIPTELLEAEMPHLESVQHPLPADPYQFDLALASLRNASLLTYHLETKTISLHRLVQAVLQDQLEPGEAHLWKSRVIRAVNAAFPEPDFAAWTRCERYLTHALACLSLMPLEGGGLLEAGELLSRVGSYLLARGRYEEARPFVEQAVTLGEQRYGMDHTMLIPPLKKQAELLWRQGKYALTEPLLLRVLALEEQYIGPSHAQTAETLNNVAVLYFYQERYAEAQPLYQRALDIQEQLFGPDHPEVANTLNNLASLYRKQQRYEMAASLHHRALRIREQHLGAEHPETALTLITLAGLYSDQGKYERAEVLCRQGLLIREKQLGPNHPDTALALNNLATLHQKQENYQQAELLFQRALTIQQRQLGKEHPQTTLTLKNLASLYRDQEKYEQAKPLYQQRLAISEQLLGSAHPQTEEMRQEYASFLERASKSSERGQLEQQGYTPAVQASTRPREKALRRTAEKSPAALPQENSSLQQFLQDCCQFYPQASILSSDLWQVYQNWAMERQEPLPLSRRALTDQLQALGCRADRTSNARIWRGIALLNNQP